MNAPMTTVPTQNRRPAAQVEAVPARRERRERDFGIGYGSSSGYASERSYVKDWGLTRFRCA
jgi:hypothetical protein